MAVPETATRRLLRPYDRLDEHFLGCKFPGGDAAARVSRGYRAARRTAVLSYPSLLTDVKIWKVAGSCPSIRKYEAAMKLVHSAEAS